ncbi:hypothetical protein [Rhodococcus qingshengii]|uniref:hypothetical protein n=1 Tax=Rhodococcus qingshengii TaxID=334542 RepID=UPI0030174880
MGIENRRRTAFRLVLLFGILTIILPSCSTESPGTSEQIPASAQISDEGFHIQFDELTVEGTGNSGDVGAQASVDRNGHSTIEGNQNMLTTISDRYQVVIEDSDGQPNAPITLRFRVDGEAVQSAIDSGGEVAVLSESAGADIPSMVEAQFNPNDSTVTATVDHLSWFQAVIFNTNEFLNKAGQGIKEVLGTGFTKPACVGDQIKYSTYSIEISSLTDDVAWTCLRSTLPGELDSPQTVELHSNSPVPWVTSSDPSPLTINKTKTDSQNRTLAIAYEQLMGSDVKFLGPGDVLTLDFKQYVGSPKSGTLTRDPKLDKAAFTSWGYAHALESISSVLFPPAKVIKVLAGCSSEINSALDAVQAVANCGKEFGSTAISFVLSRAVVSKIYDLSAKFGLDNIPNSATWKVSRVGGETGGGETSASPSSSGPAADYAPKECGPVTDRRGKSATVLNDNAVIDCAEAVSVMSQYLNDPNVNDRTYRFDGWTCSVLGAAEEVKMGYVIKCERGDNATIMLATR